MNKKKINDLIPSAYEVLKDVKIADENNKIPSGYRGQISTFGAAITMGNMISAIAFFSKKDKDSNKKDDNGVNRLNILKGIIKLLKIDYNEKDDCGAVLMNYVRKETEKVAKENIINAAIALKLSMNLYDLVKEEKSTIAGDENGKP